MTPSHRLQHHLLVDNTLLLLWWGGQVLPEGGAQASDEAVAYGAMIQLRHVMTGTQCTTYLMEINLSLNIQNRMQKEVKNKIDYIRSYTP
jgi:hypothetical protein